MKEIIRYHLLTEGRLDDMKKKYSRISPEFIDKISAKDPSGNNKYLDWMLHNIYAVMSKWRKYENPKEGEFVTNPQDPNTYSSDINYSIGYIVKVVESFHKNVDRLTPDRVYEALAKKIGHIPTNFTTIKLSDSKISPIGIWESKNINYYTPHTLGEVLNYIIEHYPSKSEIDQIVKKETTNIYEDGIIKIVAPQSFASSCMYGAETRWCTTSRNNKDYYNQYTDKNNVLIYFIFKKPIKTGDIKLHPGVDDSGIRSIEHLPFKKMALHGDLKHKKFSWFDEHDNPIKGLPILKFYLTYNNQENLLPVISEKINNYIKSKDERSALTKILRPRKLN